jgi:hypothetical protein
MDIGELIEHHEESIFLDFKREEYHAENKPELIKDVLAFANASYAAERYIIIGVVKDHERITITPVVKPQDAATIQQYVHDNITPELIVSYTPYNYKGQNLMVLTISGTDAQPYYPSKLIMRGHKPFLKEHDLWVRKGSHKVLGGREDLEKIYARRYAKPSLAGKIDLAFKHGTRSLELPVIRNLELPSEVHKAAIIRQLFERQKLYDNHGRIYLERFGHYSPGEDGDSYEAMDLKTLKERLASVERNYLDENKHYLFEQRGTKLQLVINNTGSEHLKDVMIELIFPASPGFLISESVPLTTYQLSVATGIDYQAGYPNVTFQKELIVVHSSLGEVRHKFPAEVFIKPLRVVVLEQGAGTEIKVQATVYAGNLPEPQEFELNIKFK